MDLASGILGEMASRDLRLVMSSRGRMNELMEGMEKINQQVTSELQQVSSFSEEISAGVNEALRSLQFEDMANRLDFIDWVMNVLFQLHKQFDMVKRDQLDDQSKEHMARLRVTMGEILLMSGVTRVNPEYLIDIDSGAIENF